MARLHESFIDRHTRVTETYLVPEVRLALAREATEIYSAAAAIDGCPPPYWAFAWPGGQALARHILDHPASVAGKRLLDLGTGSAIQAIAALKAGAAQVCASDIDPFAAAVARRNAALNDVALEVTVEDLLGTEPAADLVLIGDLVYEPELEVRVGAFLERACARRIPVLFADRTTGRRPPLAFALLAEYVAPVTPPLLEGHIERARVWQLG
jgi:predicted nicotinamide N-methyase